METTKPWPDKTKNGGNYGALSTFEYQVTNADIFKQKLQFALPWQAPAAPPNHRTLLVQTKMPFPQNPVLKLGVWHQGLRTQIPPAAPCSGGISDIQTLLRRRDVVCPRDDKWNGLLLSRHVLPRSQ